jgi:hypothetical protein
MKTKCLLTYTATYPCYSVVLTASGGKKPYTYSCSAINETNTSGVFKFIAIPVDVPFDFTITDSKGCSINLTETPLSCNG